MKILKLLLLLPLCIFISSCDNLSFAEMPLAEREGTAIAIGFKDEQDVLTFIKEVKAYGMAVNNLKNSAKKNAKARKFYEKNHDFDKQVENFGLKVTVTPGLAILGEAITNSYKLGKKSEDKLSMDKAMSTITTFQQTRGAMIYKFLQKKTESQK